MSTQKASVELHPTNLNLLRALLLDGSKIGNMNDYDLGEATPSIVKATISKAHMPHSNNESCMGMIPLSHICDADGGLQAVLMKCPNRAPGPATNKEVVAQGVTRPSATYKPPGTNLQPQERNRAQIGDCKPILAHRIRIKLPEGHLAH